MTDQWVLAELDTRSYTWRGIGRTDEEAHQALLNAWTEHCRHTTVGDPDLMRAAIEAGDVNLYVITPGMGMRDDSVLVRPRPAKPEGVS